MIRSHEIYKISACLTRGSQALLRQDMSLEEQKILACLKKYRELTAREISSFTKVPIGTIYDSLSKLIREGFVDIKANYSVVKWMQGRLKFSLTSTEF
jgi:DNA-binding MarR family transcriptional regulator